MQSEQSQALQTTYDTAEFDLQWRCNSHYILRLPVLAAFFFAAVIPSIFLQLSLLHFAVIFATFLGLSFAELAISSKRRSKGQRICTTTINEHGVHDLTPDGGIMHRWREISKIEIQAGDIFFYTKTGGLFVPRSAFASSQKGEEFFKTAYNLWQTHRNQNIVLGQTIASQTPNATAGTSKPRLSKEQQLEELLAEDEAVWEALEKEHQKQKENKTNS